MKSREKTTKIYSKKKKGHWAAWRNIKTFSSVNVLTVFPSPLNPFPFFNQQIRNEKVANMRTTRRKKGGDVRNTRRKKREKDAMAIHAKLGSRRSHNSASRHIVFRIQWRRCELFSSKSNRYGKMELQSQEVTETEKRKRELFKYNQSSLSPSTTTAEGEKEVEHHSAWKLQESGNTFMTQPLIFNSKKKRGKKEEKKKRNRRHTSNKQPSKRAEQLLQRSSEEKSTNSRYKECSFSGRRIADL